MSAPIVLTSPAIRYPLVSPQSNHGSYSMTRVLANGSSEAQLNDSSQQEVLIDLPNRVMNLSKSSFDFDLQIPAAAGTTRLLTVGQSAIERISLYTRSGVYLVDVPNTGIYTRAVTAYVTRHDDLQSAEKTQMSSTEAGAEATSKGFSNCASRTLTTDAVADGRCARRIVESGVPGVAAAADADCAYTESQYFTQGVLGAAGYMKFSVPLSEIHHTLFSVDKDLYFNQALVLRVSFAGTNKFGASSASAVDPGLAPVFKNLGAVLVKNIRLNLAIETNRDIADGVRSMVMSTGLSQVTPYVYTYLFTNSSPQTQVSQQQRFNSGHGASLLNIYTCTANSETTGLLSADIANTAGSSKIESYQASIDNNLLSEFRPLCRQNEDYTMQRYLMEDSCIQNSDVFRHNRVQINSWRSGKCVDWKASDTVLDGLDLSSERIYNIDKTLVSGSYRHWIFAVCQRRLNIAPSGDITMM